MSGRNDDWGRGDLPGGRPLSNSLRLLCICHREPPWTGLALQLDRLGCTEPRFRWCSTQAVAATLLRDEGFDVILIGEPSGGDTDPLVFLEALRESGTDEPVVIVSPRTDDAWLLRCGEFNAEVFSAAAGWESRALAVWIQQAQARWELRREYQRLLLSDRRRQSDGREGSESTLRRIQQITERGDSVASPTRIPEELKRRYEEVLRTYVFFGTGQLDVELERISGSIEAYHLPAGDILRMHCDCLESLLRGCGTRSVQHLQQNADLLALEILLRLADGYRRKSQLSGLGDHGVDLLHAESLRQK
jgi:hypothetical protein